MILFCGSSGMIRASLNGRPVGLPLLPALKILVRAHTAVPIPFIVVLVTDRPNTSGLSGVDALTVSNHFSAQRGHQNVKTSIQTIIL
jgi:hypothetical protein